MAIKKYKPTTPTRRFATVSTFEEITKKEPEKSLLEPLPKKAGRNCNGRITMRRRGGGHKRRYRVIDFKRRDKDGIPAKVAAIEYDPNRSSRIALLNYVDGEKRYIIAPDGLKVGMEVCSGSNVKQTVGNCLPLRDILDGTIVHAIELKIGKGAAMARAAGTSAQIMAKEGDYARLKLPVPRFAWFIWIAARQSVKQVIRITTILPWARRAGAVGSDAARKYAALP